MNATIERLVGNLKSGCNRYVNGQCMTLACLKRGGYQRGGENPNYVEATCEAHQEVTALEAMLANSDYPTEKR